MYDKAGSVLRVETTIANVLDFKVFRPSDDRQPDVRLAWRPLRKGVADLHRRAEVSRRANEAYLDALAVVDDDTPLAVLLDRVARPAVYRDRRVRPIRIGDPDDLALLQAVSRCEFSTAGFRNADPRAFSTARPPTRTSPPPTSADSRLASADYCACSAPTAPSRRSRRPTATS
jgi:hypothetical protein